MRFYPTFINLEGQKVIFSGTGNHAAAKIKLLLKTPANIYVYGENSCSDVEAWAKSGKITLVERVLRAEDCIDARLLYGANDDADEDARAVKLGKQAGALTNIVDNLEDSEFLTPAFVDRDPVTVAIGTEGTAPVLARNIKSDIEEMLPQSIGLLARIGNAFRPIAANLPAGRIRRDFWNKYFSIEGPKAFVQGGSKSITARLGAMLQDALVSHDNAKHPKGSVSFVGAGPGDPDLLTLKARRRLHDADVILHDRLVSPEILELVRREATVIEVGKTGFGPSWKQDDINALTLNHAQKGEHVVRLKSGDPTLFARLDEEIEALDSHNIDWDIIPGITSASAAAASIGKSQTRRNRNSSIRYLTGRDVQGFAEQDWMELSKPGSTAAIYMGVKAIKFLNGRLLMHGAASNTHITIVENVSRINQKVVATTLKSVLADVGANEIKGPAILFLGLSPHKLVELDFPDSETLKRLDLEANIDVQIAQRKG